MQGLGVPARLADVDADWLTSALHHSGALDTGRAERVDVRSIGAGLGLMSDVARLEVEWSPDVHPGMPTTLVIKLATQHPTNRQIAIDYGLYEREVRFYRELAPVEGVITPSAYVSDFDSTTGDMVLVMEDLGAIGSSPRAELGERELIAAVADLAHFHSAWWGQRVGAGPDWLPRFDGPTWADQQSLFGAAWAAFAARDDGTVGADFLRFGRRLVNAVPSLQRRLSQDPVTLVHFDLRRSNIFMVGSPLRLAVVDWQPLTIARGVYDVAYLLTQSVPTPLRRQCERDLLVQYRRHLSEHGVEELNDEELWTDYRLAAAYTTSYAVGMTLVDLVNEEGRAYAEVAVRRAEAATIDLRLDELV